MRARGGKTPLSPQAGIGGGDRGHVVLAILPSVTVWMRAFCSYPIMPGMPLATWVISAICRSWCRSANGLADGTLFLGVCVFSFWLLAAPGLLLPLALSLPAPLGTMAHRLRFHFGSGRSNTAPESEILDQEREDDFFMAFHTLPRRSGPHPFAQNGAEDGGGGLQEGVGALKRSTSMFIPQLLSPVDARPTRSSSVQISLQRKAADGAPDGCVPPEGPDGDAGPPEPKAPESSPPMAARVAGPQVNGTCGRRALGPVAAEGSEEAEPQGRRGPEGAGLRIQHRASSADVRQVRLTPFGADGQSGPAAPEPRRWSLQHVPDASGSSGKRCFVFQLQQPQPGAPGLGGDFNFGFTGTKGDRLVRYPRIRLERSTSYPTQPRAERGSPTEERGHPETPPRGRRVAPEIHRANSVERTPQGQGCTFKIRQDQNAGQQHFRILVTRGPEEALQDPEENNATSPGSAVAGAPVSQRALHVTAGRKGKGLIQAQKVYSAA